MRCITRVRRPRLTPSGHPKSLILNSCIAPRIYRVALDTPLRRVFDYLAPQGGPGGLEPAGPASADPVPAGSVADPVAGGPVAGGPVAAGPAVVGCRVRVP